MVKQIIIDVREPHEFMAAHVAGAQNIPLSQFTKGLEAFASIPKGTRLILYCRSGSRSELAARLLKRHGYTDVINGVNQKTVELRYAEQ